MDKINFIQIQIPELYRKKYEAFNGITEPSEEKCTEIEIEGLIDLEEPLTPLTPLKSLSKIRKKS